jgi:Patatin-like phospholipase
MRVLARLTPRMALAVLVAGFGVVIARAPGVAPEYVQPAAAAVPQRPYKKKTAHKPMAKRPVARAPSKPATLPPRVDFSAADQDGAGIPDLPDARVFADSMHAYMQVMPSAEGPWLILSEGGQDGAYGAGLLTGWSAAGNRPEFAVVTGVSAGALMAPYAFLGAKYDNVLRDQYTTLNSGDIFELAATGESLIDTWPLKELIAKQVTEKLLAQVAAEHERGRRLFVVTTNLDAGRPVLWNMGAIAAHGGQRALSLFRDILLASSAVPGMFPPVLIEVEANGRKLHEMHVDGGTTAPFYVAPEPVLSGASEWRLPAKALYVIINSKLNVDFMMPQRSTVSILGRSIAVALAAATRDQIATVYRAARRDGIGFSLAYVDPGFTQESHGVIDPDYMRALFDVGLERGKNGTAFRNDLPRLSQR